MASITFEEVGKIYADGTRAVSRLDLEIGHEEFMVLVGPSGCGKTTALRMVAGLEEITAGEIRIGDERINDVPPRDRDVAMVFQSYALYPHMTVFDNIAFGLKLRKIGRDEIRTRVERAAKTLGLSELLERKPRALSGGQRQRVAMGRAIVREPKAFLMDEPLSNLDAKLRVQMRAEISALQRTLGVTTVYVTHDQVEAMTMGDRVAVLRKGSLQQVAAPQELYDRPVNLFVAGFIGSPGMNMLVARVAHDDGRTVLRVGGAELPAPAELGPQDGRDVVLGIRPEDLDASTAAAGRPLMPGVVRLTEPLGAEVIVHIEVEAEPAVTDDVRELAAEVGEEHTVQQQAGRRLATLVARFDPDTRVREGDRIEVAIDTASLHVFDPTTGIALARGGGR